MGMQDIKEHIEEYMAAVERKGLDYGLQVHWGEVHLVTVCASKSVSAPDGSVIRLEKVCSHGRVCNWQACPNVVRVC